MTRTTPISIKNIFGIVLLVLAFKPVASFACSPMANRSAEFDTNSTTQSIVEPGTPEVVIVHISRGGERTGSSCWDIGRIMLSITPDQTTYAYRFKVVEGKSPSDSFNDKTVIGYDSNGKHMFQFSWHEPGKAAPLDFKVRVTAYSKSGSEGAFTIVHIHDDGRR